MKVHFKIIRLLDREILEILKIQPNVNIYTYTMAFVVSISAHHGLGDDNGVDDLALAGPVGANPGEFDHLGITIVLNVLKFGARDLLDPENQSESAIKIKTKSADIALISPAESRRVLKSDKSNMEAVEKNKKILKELLFFNTDWEKEENETVKIKKILASFSKAKIGYIGYDVKKGDVIKARRVHVWPTPVPHGPIVIEFKDEAVNLVKKALRGAAFAQKLRFEFGAIFCEISCQSIAGNRWPRLRYRLMEVSEKTITIKSADHPFPQKTFESKPANMSDQRQRNNSNRRALRVIEVNDPDVQDQDQEPIQAPSISSSSTTRQRVTQSRGVRDRNRRGTRQIILENIARSRSISNQVHEIDSSTSSSSSDSVIIFTGASTPNPVPQAGPSGLQNITESTTENVVIDLTISSEDPDPDPNAPCTDANHSNPDYYTAPETPERGRGGADGGDDDDIPDLEEIEMEMAAEAELLEAAVPETITIATSTDSTDDTDTYLESVSLRKIAPSTRPARPMVVENDVITLDESSELESDSWVDRSPSTTSTDDERDAEISREELRDIERQVDENHQHGFRDP